MQTPLETTPVSSEVRHLVENYSTKKNETSSVKRRKTWSEEEVQSFQSLCKKHNLAQAVRSWNLSQEKKMSMNTAYVLRGRDPIDQRGRPLLLTESENAELLTAINYYNGQNQSVDAPFVASIAKGLLDKTLKF